MLKREVILLEEQNIRAKDVTENTTDIGQERNFNLLMGLANIYGTNWINGKIYF